MTLPLDVIQAQAHQAGLDPALVAAFCMTEDAPGDPFATRFEPNYRWVYRPKDISWYLGLSLEDEIRNQKTSWGLMQVMGAVAREFGFRGGWSQMADPATNIYYGCQLLKRLHGKYVRMEDVIAAYNAGSVRMDDDGKYVNQGYVDKVMKNWKGKP